MSGKDKKAKPDPDPAVAEAQARVDETSRRLAEALAKRAEASAAAKESASAAVDRLQLEHAEAVDQLGELKAQRATAKGHRTKDRKHHRRQAAAQLDHPADAHPTAGPPRSYASGPAGAGPKRPQPAGSARDIEREWDALDEQDRSLNEQERRAGERREREEFALKAAAAAQQQDEAEALRRETQLRAAREKELRETEARQLAEQRRRDADLRKAAALARHEQQRRAKRDRRDAPATDAQPTPTSWSEVLRGWCRDFWRWVTFRSGPDDPNERKPEG